MDFALLLIQIILVCLLIVVPVFSGFDKWQKWSPGRKLLVVALGAGVGLVAFSQYKRVMFLHKGGLPQAFTKLEGNGLDDSQRIWVTPVEYLGTMAVASLLGAFAVQAVRSKKWAQALAYAGVQFMFLDVAFAVKTKAWR